MAHLTIKGLVIRETDFGDNDRYISVLTESGARIEVLCRGVRRRGGRMANAVRLFCWSELTLFQSRGKYTLNTADLVTSFWGITQDMERYALACYLAELTAEMTDADEECPAATRLLLYALRALSDAARDPLIIKAAFELRLMAETGFAPDLSCCTACGGALGEEVWFSPREGTARCAPCIERLGYLGHKRLQTGTAHALSHILTAEIPRVNAFSLGEPARTQLAQICEEYTLARAERNFDSLKFYQSLQLLPTALESNT